mgnify:CR=1 FL=1
MEFIPAEEAAYLIAQYKGYGGSMISGMMGNPIGMPLIFEYAYPENSPQINVAWIPAAEAAVG